MKKINWEKVKSKSKNRQTLMWVSDIKLDIAFEDSVVLSIELVKFVGGFRWSYL